MSLKPKTGSFFQFLAFWFSNNIPYDRHSSKPAGKRSWKMYIQNLSQASAEKIMTGVVLRNHRDIIISYRITVQSPDLGSFLLKVLVIEVLWGLLLHEYFSSGKKNAWDKNLFKRVEIWKKEKSVSHVRLFATPWTVACQDPLSMG